MEGREPGFKQGGAMREINKHFKADLASIKAIKALMARVQGGELMGMPTFKKQVRTYAVNPPCLEHIKPDELELTLGKVTYKEGVKETTFAAYAVATLQFDPGEGADGTQVQTGPKLAKGTPHDFKGFAPRCGF